MKRIVLFLILVLFVLVNASGCAPLIIGAAVGTLGGYAISKDTIQGETDVDYETLWNAARSVARFRGTVKSEDYVSGYVNLEADSSKVWIRLIRLTQNTTRLNVWARKYHLPNLSLAQDIFFKIMEQAK